MSGNVIATLHNADAHRCVKIIRGDSGTFGFREFRRDPEDAGGWSLVSETPAAFATEAQALAAAEGEIAWLQERTP